MSYRRLLGPDGGMHSSSCPDQTGTVCVRYRVHDIYLFFRNIRNFGPSDMFDDVFDDALMSFLHIWFTKLAQSL